MALTVATWNVWWRFGPWRERAELIEQELAAVDADVVGLQEVHAEVGDRPDPAPGRVHVDVDADPATSQVAHLAAELGYPWSATAWRHADDGVAFGNGLLSRIPPRDVHAAPLDTLGGRFEEHRTVLAAELTVEGQDVLVATTHLNFMWDQSRVRQAQVDGITAFLAQHRRGPQVPVVLTGDLNATPDSQELARLTGHSTVPTPGLAFVDAWAAVGDHAGATWSLANDHAAADAQPERRIDYVLVSRPDWRGRSRIRAARRFGTVRGNGIHPSDHFGVVATFDPSPSTG